MSQPLSYLNYMRNVVEEDVRLLYVKEKSYGSSWKKRGGVGAFMMLARKWDRIENLLDQQTPSYDVFKGIEYNTSGDDSTILAEVRDLRRYLILVEAEMMSRGNVRPTATRPGTPEDGGHHARQDMAPSDRTDDWDWNHAINSPRQGPT